jgi:hypothetical protein
MLYREAIENVYSGKGTFRIWDEHKISAEFYAT